jgi:type IX secretion system PorP/SprF family membrane protein
MKKLLPATLLLPLLFFTMPRCLAQDPQFTQFNANPLLLNPSYTGATRDVRLVVQSRRQWVDLPGKVPHTGQFDTYAMGLDYFHLRSRFGVGLVLTSDNAGSLGVNTQCASLSLAHEVRIARRIRVRAGMQAAAIQRSIADRDLFFEDQLTIDGFTGLPSMENLADIGNRSLNWDMAAGILASAPRWWSGFAMHNLRQADLSLFTNSGDDNRTAIRYSMEAGFITPVTPGVEVRMHALLRHQGGHLRTRWRSNRQLDLGVNWNLKVLENEVLVVGANYRGLTNADALAPVVRWEHLNAGWGDLSFGYSYDFTLSQLGNTGGSHEIMMIFKPKEREEKRRQRIQKTCDYNQAKRILENFGWAGAKPSNEDMSRELGGEKRKDYPIMYSY